MTTVTMSMPFHVDRFVTRMLQSAINTLSTRAGKIRQENKTEADIKNLHELPPHLLRDIGISHDQISVGVANNFYKGSL